MTIEHIAITTADIDRLRRFYSTYFGMEAEAEIIGSTGSRITFMHSPDGGARIELMQSPKPPTGRSFHLSDKPMPNPASDPPPHPADKPVPHPADTHTSHLPSAAKTPSAPSSNALQPPA